MRRRSLIIAVALLVSFGVAISILNPGHPDTLPPPPSDTIGPVHYALNAKKEDYIGVEQPSYSQQVEGEILGGIVSHHLLAGEDIGKFFAELRNRKIRTVVIVGPNHYGVGEGEILVSEYPYETPWGRVNPDVSTISQLMGRGVVTLDETPFEKEHSISALVPYIAASLPGARIVPIVLRGGVDEESRVRLSSALSEILPADAIVVASVDFSHHLNQDATLFHDDMAIAAITNFDYERILRAEIDSPASIDILLRYLESRGGERKLSRRVNAAEIMGNPTYTDVTSYLFAHFIRGERVPSRVVTSLHFGDMMLGRAVGLLIKNGGDPFKEIRGIEGNFLRGIDIITANLEGPITDQTDCQDKENTFRFSTTTAYMLNKEGFTALNLANNHSNDCYKAGIDDTRRLLGKVGIATFGGGGSDDIVVERSYGGVKVALLGIDETSMSNIDLKRYGEQIETLKKKNDLVIVHLHWGYEYDTKPSQIQMRVGHEIIDRGADMIIGHHPHVAQPAEIYKGKAIFYSLGNFIFDQIDLPTKIGYGVGATYRDGMLEYTVFPYTMSHAQPKLMSVEEARIFCQNILSQVGEADGCRFAISE